MSRRFLSQNNLASFKVKLVVYFLLLALLPLAALFWGFTGVASRSEERLVDARLTAGLRAALGIYSEQLDGVARTAAQLARAPEFQASLAARDRLALLRVLQDDPELRVVAPGDFRVGVVPGLAAARVVRVVGPGGRLVGRVIASVPLDASLAETLRRRAGLESADRVLVLSRDAVVGGPPELAGAIGKWSASSRTLRLAGKRYRGLASGPLPEQRGAALAVVTPQSTIDAANRSFQRRYLFGLLVSLALLGIVAALQGRAVLRAISRLVVAANAIAGGSLKVRVPIRGHDELAVLGDAFNRMAEQLQARLDDLEAERERLRDAFTRLGEALAATHDPEQLLRVIVETAVEATGAAGGILVSRAGDVVQIGYPEEGDQSLEVPLTAGNSLSFGTLILYGQGFSAEQRMTAASLAAQAVVALENARLHQIVERQASLDGLTGLANRRQSEDALAAELARAERLGGSVAIVLADLDGFKSVNDRYGHPSGDAVLREFAQVLRNSVREIDTAGRWGGEEFVVLLPGTDAAGGAKLAERLRRDLESGRRRTQEDSESRRASTKRSDQGIAVLYFENLSGVKEDEYFRDGITEDIITELSKIKGIKVFPRPTVLAYRDKSVTPQLVGRELGAAFVLGGSIRRADTRLRINAQLMDAHTDFPIWSERYDREMKDIFEVQDEIARKIAEALRITLTPQEQEELAAKPTDNLQAYDLYLKGKSYARRLTRQDLEFALQMFENAVALDPNFALAHAAIANVCAQHHYNYGRDARWMERAMSASERAVILRPELPEVLVARAWILYAGNQYDDAVRCARQAIERKRDCEGAYYILGRALFAAGKYQELTDVAEAALDVLAILPFGYPAQIAGQGKKTRKALSEVAHRERFGQPFQ